ncbi:MULTISPECIES: hypothetical protein [unclassified Variovorax]|uniref:hypothetical protein n=1 Tax=unclassified Variovorax TaxID=663243 RepID=UPI000AEE87CC|nr:MULTISPECIES: hypothetical protein [unclassified Variovorax]PNG50181.1 hypothetical protein CHC06_05804 [Variovorax sp. B2]PNG51054.1 hypothetical protein CHC07_05710 [Variovorax sp. B4]VTV17233.1 hypothetical protein WDL1P1_00220 [Variovorax sp. WDL1]
MDSLPSEVVYEFGMGAQELTRKAPLGGAAHITLGLTQANFQLSSSWEGQTLVDRATGLACARPKVKVQVQVGPQCVTVAKEFPKGTCAFWEIAEHELRHVKANQAHAERVADELKAALSRSFGNRVFYGTPGELRVVFTENLKSQWLPWGKSRFDGVKAAHRQIDSLAEYARNNTMCDGEVPRALGAPFARRQS